MYLLTGINDKHNFIKENIMALKQKAQKPEVNQNPLQNYQKGVLPKYLRDRKEEQKKELEGDTECPEGHVLLPEEERKETLRVLRQSKFSYKFVFLLQILFIPLHLTFL